MGIFTLMKNQHAKDLKTHHHHRAKIMQRVKYNYQSNLIRDAVGLLPLKVLPFLDTVDFVFDYNPFYLGFNHQIKQMMVEDILIFASVFLVGVHQIENERSFYLVKI